MKIYVKNNDIGKALRVLKKKMYAEGDTKELRESTHFTSKGEKKRIAEKAGRKRWFKYKIELEKERERKEREAYRRRKKAQRNNNGRNPNYKGKNHNPNFNNQNTRKTK